MLINRNRYLLDNIYLDIHVSECKHYTDAGGVQHVSEHVVMTRLVLGAGVLAMNDYNCTNSPGYCCLPRMTLRSAPRIIDTGLAWSGNTFWD